MSNYTASTSLSEFILEKKDEASLNTKGSLVFGVRIFNETFGKGDSFSIRFPVYYDP